MYVRDISYSYLSEDNTGAEPLEMAPGTLWTQSGGRGKDNGLEDRGGKRW